MTQLWKIGLVCLLVALLAACFSPEETKKIGREEQVDKQMPKTESETVNDDKVAHPDVEGVEASLLPVHSVDPEQLEAGMLHLQRIAPDNAFEQPIGLQSAPGRASYVYVVEQPGRIVQLDLSNPAEMRVVLDIGDRVFASGWEQGLLGLVFHPEFDRNGRLFVNYTTEQESIIAEYAWVDADERIDADSERVLLAFEQPYANHNGGDLAFGPDGWLYIGTGDGGSGGDPQNYAQNRESLLGKMLRLNIEETTPVLDMYAIGLRNPWRYSFDPANGQLWLADVGQNAIEEINIIIEGGNYGWRIKEGTSCYKPRDCHLEGLIDPIWEYTHKEGRSITGGHVYRGQKIIGLDGWYVYGDYISGTIWALGRTDDGEMSNHILFESGLPISSFGTDEAGELYVVSHNGSIYRIEKS